MTEIRRAAPSVRYQALLSKALSSEDFVREALQSFEADFRTTALLALADWQKLEIVRAELFQAVASLQRPSWGMWNGLISSLKNARKEVLRSTEDADRERIESATFLNTVLKQFELRLDSDVTASLKPLAELCRTTLSGKLRLGSLLTMPISLRNRIAHDVPSAPEWWEQAAAALRPLVEFHAHLSPLSLLLDDEHDYPAPWFLVEDGVLWTFNGLDRDYSVNYVADDGNSKNSKEQAHATVLAFQTLLGKTESQDDDFRMLLSKLAPDEIKGVMLGGHLVGRPVGSGGFATVHVARELSTGRRVALKILHDGQTERTKERFQQEARFLSRLDHPHIVDVFGYGEDTWSAPRNISLSDEPWFQSFSKTSPVRTYIAMEWVDGETLDSVIRPAQPSRQSEDEASSAVTGSSVPSEFLEGSGKRGRRKHSQYQIIARWFAEAASALSAVQNSGLVHRDIKPSNLMFDSDGHVHLMDFGIARSQDRERTLKTTTGGALGTPAYMAPEQLKASEGDEVGPAADVYGLCATFYEVFTGTRLFDHDTSTLEVVTTKKLSGDRPRRPRRLAKGLPWELETILMGGLEHRVRDRYPSMEALRLDIENFLRDEPITYRRPGLLRRLRLGYRRNRLVTNVVLCFLVAGGILTNWYIGNLKEATTIAEANADDALKEKSNAISQRGRAELSASLARQRSMLVKASHLLERDPTLALLLAQDSLRNQIRDDSIVPECLSLIMRGFAMTGGSVLVEGDPPHPGFMSDLHTACAISPDGRWAVIGGPFVDAQLFDLTAENPAAEHVELGCVSRGFQFSDDGSVLVSIGAGFSASDDPDSFDETPDIRIWNVSDESSLKQSAKVVDGIYVDKPNRFSVSPDGRWIATVIPSVEFGVLEEVKLIDLHASPTPSESAIELRGDFTTTNIAFTRRGDSVIRISKNGSVQLHEFRNGKMTNAREVKAGDFERNDPFTEYWGITSEIVESADSKYVFIGHRNTRHIGADQVVEKGSLHQLDLKDRDRPVRRRIELQTGVTAMVFLPAGFGFEDRISAGASDGTIRIWPVQLEENARPETEDRQPLLLIGHEKAVTQLSAIDEGRKLVSASEDGTIRIWDLSDPNPRDSVQVMYGHNAGISEFALSESSDGLVSVDRNGMGRLWSLHQTTIVPRFKGSKDPGSSSLKAPAASIDAGHIALADGKTIVILWSEETRATRALIGPNGHVNHVAFDPSARWCATAADEGRLDRDGTVRLWQLDQEDAAGIELPDTGGNAQCVEFSADGNRLAAGIIGAVDIWDLTDGIPESSLHHLYDQSDEATELALEFVLAIRFSPDGKRLRTAGRRGNEGADGLCVTDWDLTQETPSPRVILTSDSPVNEVTLSPDGNRLATGNQIGDVVVWRLDSPDIPSTRQIIRGHTTPITSLSFSSDGRLIAVSDAHAADIGGRVLLHRLDEVKSEPVEVFTLPQNRAVGATFARAGSKLAVAYEDASVRIWEIDKRKLDRIVDRFVDRSLTWSERRTYGADDSALIGTLADFGSCDFESGNLSEWERTGTAFKSPLIRDSADTGRLFKNIEGSRFLSSHAAGRQAVGTLTSPEFRIERGWINMLVAGGKHFEKTRVELLIMGDEDDVFVPVRVAVGSRYGGSATWELVGASYDPEQRHIYHEWRSWDVSEFIGSKARIRFVDEADDPDDRFGFISCDHIIQSWWILEMPINEVHDAQAPVLH